MKFISVKTTDFLQKYIITISDRQLMSEPNIIDTNDFYPRTLSQIGTDDYNRSLRRAFTRAKILAFFNPDLTQFITLTYKQSDNTPQQVVNDIKLLIKKTNYHLNKQININKVKVTLSTINKPTIITQLARKSLNNFSTCAHVHIPNQDIRTCVQVVKSLKHESLESNFKAVQKTEKISVKYLYVMELQKRGSIHVHMVASEGFRYQTNTHGHLELKDWLHGFTNVQTIDSFDNNFKPYLYLFKYMSKAQRVGNQFIHTSRNFDKIKNIDYSRIDNLINTGVIQYQETINYKLLGNDNIYTITKNYITKKG